MPLENAPPTRPAIRFLRDQQAIHINPNPLQRN